MSDEFRVGTPVPKGYRYADHVPYDTPESLESLKGPVEGIVRVGPPISTAPDPLYDLADQRQVWHLYSATVRDGSVADQVALLDQATLERLWPELNLPARCRAIWERKFPVLAARTAAQRTA